MSWNNIVASLSPTHQDKLELLKNIEVHAAPLCAILEACCGYVSPAASDMVVTKADQAEHQSHC